MTDIATDPKASTGAALIKLLYVARGLRGFGDGFAIIILLAYMTALGYDAIAVGIIATASLLGTALLTLITGWIAPRHDLRPLLIAGASLMAGHRRRLSRRRAFCADRAGRIHRHDQRFRRRSRCAGAA
ncbi:MFS family permease [Bradyrhizobium sp. AZCC 1578]